MYRTFFGLTERPFDLTPNPRYLVFTDAHREALCTVEYAFQSRKGITLLVGEAGTGKTTIIRAALERQNGRTHCVHLHNPALTREEFIHMLATRFGLSDAAKSSKTVLLLELEAMLQQRADAGEATILIVDEAQSLPLELLEEIRLLANIETDTEKLLSVVIAGQPELAVRLNRRDLRQLKQRIALRCELRSLTAQETAGYIAGRIRAAGGEGTHLFTRDAIAVIHERSSGIPRAISVIADNALLAAFAGGHRPVTRQIALDVCREYDVGTTPPESAPEPKASPEPAAHAAPKLESVAAPAPGPAPEPARTFSMSPNLRILALDVAMAEPVAVADPPPAEEETRGIFGSLYGKRRRFSFF